MDGGAGFFFGYPPRFAGGNVPQPHRKKGRRDFARRPLRAALQGNSLTLAISAIATEITAACVFKLAMTLGADADHV